MMGANPKRFQLVRNEARHGGPADPQRPLADVREHTARLDGLRIHVRDVGSGRPVVLINGLGGHTEMWAAAEQALHDLRVISFDAPGAGQSDTPLLPVSVPRLARLTTLVMDSLEVKRADVVGYSMGGMVAQQLALDAPQRVRRVVLAATTCGLGAIPGEALAMLNLTMPVRYISSGFYARTLGGVVGGRARHDPEWVETLAQMRLRHVSLRGFFGQMVSLSRWSSLAFLPRVSQPTLVVAGDDDPLVPLANAMLLAHRLPQGRLLTVPGEGHLMLLHQETPVLQRIAQFLAAQPLEQAPVWQDATRVTEDEVHTAIAAARSQAQPWGALGALMRRTHRATERPDPDR